MKSKRPEYRVLAFTVKPEEAPEARYRILQYRKLLQEWNVAVDHLSLLNRRFFFWQKRQEHPLLRALCYPLLFLKRLSQVLTLVPRYDAIWIGREMAPLGPPILEKLVLRLAARVILDIDDALHVADGASSGFVHRHLRDFSKYAELAKYYSAVVCGNRFLADYFRQWSSNVHVIPTVVDTRLYASLTPTPSPIVRLGWVGTPTNAYHLEFLKPALLQLARERTFEFVVVGLNQPLNWEMPGVHCVDWELARELEFFTSFDIGIMPLKDFEFTKAKSAFKLIQYMAAGLPVVASPVGANEEVVRSGINGFLARSAEEWVHYLKLLIDDACLRQRFGQAGRKIAQDRYSLERCWPEYAAILQGKPSAELVPVC